MPNTIKNDDADALTWQDVHSMGISPAPNDLDDDDEESDE